MAQAKAIDLSAAEKALGVELFKNRRASQALHEAVTAYRAARRSGTHSTKTKGTVDLSGAKPWNQKGTGRARAGYKASPVWRGGGVAFGPHPRSYRKDIPKTVLRTALRRAISDLATQGKLHSGTAPSLKAAKTKELIAWLKDAGLPLSVLLILGKPESTLLRAASNLGEVDVRPAREVNAEDLLRRRMVWVSEEAWKELGSRLNAKAKTGQTS
ncbi:MAG: 50S ribosomal protein L4 [Verrucomicrobia bacterium]|nr:50S ribosomal protein L4 [Pseudomonadota bacterium]NBS07043.1 50S ribosomal protein L4 [Verrucomicrobiota bacterium]NBS78776.1 50S ribosomal protein L4 [bacterium]NBS49208.1 50S ribosomal protein L4 [Verrucomicrobiota bacterium]NBT23508.1 50S ribosomal protein L4 [bacterium]